MSNVASSSSIDSAHEEHHTLKTTKKGLDTPGEKDVNGDERVVDQSAPANLQPFAHGFFDSNLTPLRMAYFKMIGMVAILLTIIIWICLPFYWGALWKERSFSNRLTTYLIDLDGGSEVSQAISTAVSVYPASGALGWTWEKNATLRSVSSVEAALLNNEAWAAIVITQGAAGRLAAARAVGNASYVPTQAVLGIYQTARNEIAAGNFIVGSFSSIIIPALARLSAQSAAAYLSANANNATAIQLLSSAPQTISSGYGFSTVDLRPYTATVATAVTLVGLIYLLVLSLIIGMAHEGARALIQPYLTLRSYIALRLVVPAVIYLYISLIFGMINLPFHVPFDAKFSYAGGFFLWWTILWLGMSAFGYAIEFMVTLVGAKFMAFFLIPLIIINVSESSLPISMQPWIYRVGYAFPFYNLNQAVRTIIFNTKNDLGLNAGVLIAWIALSCCTMTTITVFRRNQEKKVLAKKKKDDQHA